MPDYLATPGSSYSRDQTGIRRIELSFIIPGPAEADGKRCWRFTLEFPAEVSANTVAEYVAAWGESAAPGEVDWSGPTLAAVEVEPAG